MDLSALGYGLIQTQGRNRAGLYGFRGAALCGMGNEIWDNFSRYIKERLTGYRAPYAVEAWPEGDMRHLSGESALFCRIILESFLGLRAEGLIIFRFSRSFPMPCLIFI